ncbi:MAG: helix-turn-helix domain-containing protein [Methylophilaceae bacterium]|nr:helix-turn-helix domain-containing protein [Methylophilaceae bacterium]
MLCHKSLPSPDESAEALAAVVALRVLADKLDIAPSMPRLNKGWSWSQIAEALGVSKQAAHKRLANVHSKTDS